MKISAQDAAFIDWKKVDDALHQDAAIAVTHAVEDAQTVFAKLKPGERKTITIKAGSITIVRPK
jgi:hypothetical protein